MTVTATKETETKWIISYSSGAKDRVYFGRAGMTEQEVIADVIEWDYRSVPTEAEILEDHKATVVAAIDDHVEMVAKSRGYNNAATLAGYATSTVQVWASEANAFIAWRDQVWQLAYSTLASVEVGEIDVPTVDEVTNSLPAITWPS